jgi:predicted phage terminase large subunit-like protein
MPEPSSLLKSLASLPTKKRLTILKTLSQNELALLDAEWHELLKTDFLTFATHAMEPLGFTPAAHHKLLIRELQAVADGKCDRLMVSMPPGSAKSTYASVLFPAWLMASNPNMALIGASHTADLAEAFSRRVMRTVREHTDVLGYGLATESVGAWGTSHGAEYKAAGVGGPITGRRADCAIVDDPVKSRADAESETYRERTWDWYSSDLRTRLKPGGRVVLIMTRWHMDDLGGRLLDRQPGMWRVVSLPAQAGENDMLGRNPGDWLWADDAYGYGADLQKARAECEANGQMRDWHALYQQQPRPEEGSLFKVTQLAITDTAPVGGRDVRAWDLAATANGGDWTAGARIRRLPDGRFLIVDVVRLRGGPEQVEAAIVNTAAQDGHGVTVSLPQDPGQAGKAQVLYLTRKLAGYRVESSPETGDKITRAGPLAAQLNVGNVSLVKAPGNVALIEEMRDFPNGTHDDQVDALSRAFAALITRQAMNISSEALRRI